MNDKLQRIVRQVLIALAPFLFVGILIAAVAGLLIISYYILVWGIMIGVILWVYTLIKRYFLSQNTTSTNKTTGRIIDHDKRK